MTALCQSPHCRPARLGGPRQAEGTWPLCATCEDRVDSDLRDIARIWPDTEEALRAPNTTGHSEPVTGSRNHRLPLNEAVADARAETLRTLTTWAQIIAATAGLNPPAAVTLDRVPELATWLARHHRALTRNYDPEIGVGSTFTHDLRRQLRRVTYPTGARRFPGRNDPQLPCVEHTTNEHGERVPCPGVYYAWITDRQDGFPDLTCSEDEDHILAPTGFRRLGRAALDPAATARLVAALTERTPA